VTKDSNCVPQNGTGASFLTRHRSARKVDQAEAPVERAHRDAAGTEPALSVTPLKATNPAKMQRPRQFISEDTSDADNRIDQFGPAV